MKGPDRFSFQGMRPYIGSLAVLAVFSAFLHLISHVDISGDFEGVYVFRSDQDAIFDVRDDIFLGDEGRLLFRLEFEPLIRIFRVGEVTASDGNFLTVDWHASVGRGYVIDNYPDGRKLLLTFSRFRAENGMIPSGLFLGGELPFDNGDRGEEYLNKTGMAFYDGERWFHLWCSVNEAVASGSKNGEARQLSQWNYLGSEIVYGSDTEIVLKSDHGTVIDGTPLRIEKFMMFRAGEAYFILLTRVVNVGQAAVHYRYAYGDEPWVGDYGSSTGDIGWVEGRLIRHEELLDTSRYSLAGMVDQGNELAGEEQNFSGMANFIQWSDVNRPSLAYISNAPGVFSRVPGTVPLTSGTRFIGLEWGPRVLAPGGADTFVLAVGMARKNPLTGAPEKPVVDLDRSRHAFIK